MFVLKHTHFVLKDIKASFPPFLEPPKSITFSHSVLAIVFILCYFILGYIEKWTKALHELASWRFARQAWWISSNPVTSESLPGKLKKLTSFILPPLLPPERHLLHTLAELQTPSHWVHIVLRGVANFCAQVSPGNSPSGPCDVTPLTPCEHETPRRDWNSGALHSRTMST